MYLLCLNILQYDNDFFKAVITLYDCTLRSTFILTSLAREDYELGEGCAIRSFIVFSLASLKIAVIEWNRPAYLYRFSRDIPILALNHDFPISCGGVPILEDAGIFRAFRFGFVLFSPVFPNPPRILHLPLVKALRCRYK